MIPFHVPFAFFLIFWVFVWIWVFSLPQTKLMNSSFKFENKKVALYNQFCFVVFFILQNFVSQI
jgi:hypothetical protein